MKRQELWVVALACAAAAVACEGAPLVGGVVAGAPGSDAGGADAGADAAVAPDRPPLPTRSAGCDQPTDLAFGRYVMKTETVPNVPAAYAATYTQRVYWVRLPKVYDPGHAYPVAFLGPGCGASGDSAIPLQEASKDDAILVGLNGIDNCFTHDVADTPELPYFDETVKNVEAELCVDPSHLFVAGFSSGSWLATTLGCARADVLKAQASVAGGLPPMPACKGPIPAMYVSDTDDSKNQPATVKEALDRVLAVDGCSAETEPYDIGVPSPCVRYKGCLPGFPVVSCVTSGLGHADQSSTHVSTTGFWHFWTSLP